MNKRQIIASLNKIANELDINKLYKEANTITNVMIKIADEFRDTYETEPDLRYAPERFKDEIANIINKYNGDLDEIEKRQALITLIGYLKSKDKKVYYDSLEEEFSFGTQPNPQYKLEVELVRFADRFYREMNLEEMDYKYLVQAVRELM